MSRPPLLNVSNPAVPHSRAIATVLNSCARDCLCRRYHSHPHLSVVPSHVDVRTQALYQQMDSAFVGLIFSVFNSGRVVPGVPTGTQESMEADGTVMVSMNAQGTGRIQITAFQSGAVDAQTRPLPPPPPHCVSNWTHGRPSDWPTDVQAPSSYVHKEVRLSGRLAWCSCRGAARVLDQSRAVLE